MRLLLGLCPFMAGVLLTHDTAIAAAALSHPFAVDTSIPRRDFDQDGLPDAYEQRSGLNWQVADADDDPDSDGKTNLQEYNAGTNPTTPDYPDRARMLSTNFFVQTGGVNASLDSDSDGMPDWWELRYGFNPGSPDGADDYDLDGRSNLAEFLSGKDPTVDDRVFQSLKVSHLFSVDTGGRFGDGDGDGLPNWWESLFFTNATAAARADDADADRHNNLQEYLAGTDPTDQRSVLRIVELHAGPSSIIRWSSVAARTYSLWRIAPDNRVIEPLASNLVATPPLNSFTNTSSTGTELYRISTTP